MGDMGEIFNEAKRASQEKRANNRRNSLALLDQEGVIFEKKNGGAHLIVEQKIDFWPGTGLWIERGGKRGRGVHKLLKYLRQGQTTKEQPTMLPER